MSTQLSHALARIKVLEDNLVNTFAYIKEVRLEAHNAAVAAERERCALVCERNIDAPAGTYQILMAAAAAIRKGE
jgi:hypothetical protein